MNCPICGIRLEEEGCCGHCPWRRDDRLLKLLPDAVGDHFGCTKKSLLGTTRVKHVTHSRQVLFYMARECTYYSFPALGKHFDRHHSTIFHAHAELAEALAAGNGRRHLRTIMGHLHAAMPEFLPHRLCPTCEGEGVIRSEEHAQGLLQ